MDQFERRQYSVAMETLRAVRSAECTAAKAREQTDTVDVVLDYIEGERASLLKDVSIN
jgi:hypothetical protein